MVILTYVQRAVAMFCSPLVMLFGLLGLHSGVSNDYRQYKNVILMIGDGMGFNHLNSAKQALGVEELVMESMPVHGESKTSSLDPTGPTDSAAGASALACGIRNISGQVSVYALDPLGWIKLPKSLSEQAIERGKSAGVVTTDSTSGATPSAFSSHASSRDDEPKLSKGQLSSGLQLIWGAASASINAENTAANGFTLVKDKAAWESLQPTQRSFAQFSGNDLSKTENTDVTPTLVEMTSRAIDILDDDPDGFFLMVEGAHIDKFSHGRDMPNMVHSLEEFDKAIAAALEYVRSHNNTLLVVTADHETGGIQYDAQNGYQFTSGSHTGVNVPLFVSALDAGFTHGQAVKNRQIGVQLGVVMGFLAEENNPFYFPPRREEAA